MAKHVLVIGAGPAGLEAARAAAMAEARVTLVSEGRLAAGPAGTVLFPARSGWLPPTRWARLNRRQHWDWRCPAHLGPTRPPFWPVFGPLPIIGAISKLKD
ncbi:MAG: FAD-dependent oxidoreductase [Anaerolineales bacterium]|nr:FAD-dependent oxidoreductase [Anaerolineales bacterium]